MIAETPVLTVDALSVDFATPDGTVAAVREVDFELMSGERLGVLGESGCGKSQLFLALLGLLAPNGRARGHARFAGQDLLALPAAALRRLRGNRIAMVFQDPMTALNPYLTIGTQLTEVLTVHRGLGSSAARQDAAAMLGRVGLPEPVRTLERYPHELSGGMRQRVLIAMALLCDPELLIADEPTTALDVTVQGQIVALLRSLDITQILITHDFGVLAGFCHRVLVMYAGRIVESGAVREIFRRPRHPYTRGLMRAIPHLEQTPRAPLATIAGQPPDLARAAPGCAFAPRCELAEPRCRVERPLPRAIAAGATVACHLAEP
ncbi:MAG: ABC transporter ATP-binding protein [Proteobacteria bacterium]|nr:ABC transporter ATP-binding protein [Pseudomonadota bacterium]